MTGEAHGSCAPIARIIRSSSVDGPGNRVVVFTQGCNFDCSYCHNPETIPSFESSSGLVPERARAMRADDVAALALSERPFAIGLTVSGGECTLHGGFLSALAELVRSGGMNVLLDSNGSIPFDSIPGLMASIDGAMLDIKAWDSEEHRRICGVGNERVLANLALLAGAGLLVEARTVVSPGLFDVERTVRETAAALSRARDSRFGPPTYRLAAFRRRGVRERWAGLAEPDGAYMARLAKLALDAGAPRVLFI